MQPVMHDARLRLLCHVDEFEDLLADLALHHLDAALADRTAPPNPNLRLYSHPLGSSAIAWYAPRALAARARRNFPHSLGDVPMLLPTAHAAVRVPIGRWFDRHGIRPLVVGEFEDSALLKTFGAEGMGVFPAVDPMHDQLVECYRVVRIGACDGVHEHFHVIGTEKKVAHPLVEQLLAGAGRG